ncbi:alcohol dehydrogenase class IV [Rhizobium sp. ERR 922]|uniref:iron-containing alcohol dehydrogenase n=1 Tax=unclassified Rhizobium TaxID=2613769 RepID=UPI0011A7734C|nr:MULTISPECIES: iron-containing alcohol dehydrogenase [unclassified Rhizobium]TWB53093.1 alcohol dehydrogenase class IV [Rhizobium sp. ERR 922]TWB95942.1 alcohol dehydrogenase class IV [Rhizobium sp. ERR 942]
MSAFVTPIDLVQPARIVFGAGTASQVGSFLTERGMSRILVVTDPYNATRVAKLNLPGQPAVWSDFTGEPDTAELARLIAIAEAADIDAVIGFGGGSSMDLAKLAAVLPNSGQSFQQVVGAEKVHTKGKTLVQVPTTAGTGSEVGTRALVTDLDTRSKSAVQSMHMLADIAVIDPELALGMPRALTVSTGVDALAHCVEAYTNRKAHPLIDVYALEGIRLVGEWLPKAADDSQDVAARSAMALASLYGGYCLGPVNTAAGHAVAYPLGTRFHVPHGAANALIFPHVLAFNAPAVPERTAAILTALGLPTSSDPEAVLAAAHDWCVRLGCEMRLSAFGVTEADTYVMAKEAHAIRRLLDNNPRDLSEADIVAMYRAAA